MRGIAYSHIYNMELYSLTKLITISGRVSILVVFDAKNNKH